MYILVSILQRASHHSKQTWKTLRGLQTSALFNSRNRPTRTHSRRFYNYYFTQANVDFPIQFRFCRVGYKKPELREPPKCSKRFRYKYRLLLMVKENFMCNFAEVMCFLFCFVFANCDSFAIPYMTSFVVGDVLTAFFLASWKAFNGLSNKLPWELQSFQTEMAAFRTATANKSAMKHVLR